MKVTQKWAILTTVALLSCGAMVFGGYLYFTAKISIPSRDELEGKADLQVFYDKALNYESLISEKPAELQNYLALGGAWKLIGDNTKDRRWHKLSLNAYERGIEITNRRNSVLLTNAGHIEEQLGNYAEAKKYYSEAIDLSPGDVNYYLMYINLLRYKTKASTDEILSVYERGMERVLGGADLISNRSQYFKAIGRYADARRDLEILLTNNVITQQQMDSELLEMKKLEEAAN